MKDTAFKLQYGAGCEVCMKNSAFKLLQKGACFDVSMIDSAFKLQNGACCEVSMKKANSNHSLLLCQNKRIHESMLALLHCHYKRLQHTACCDLVATVCTIQYLDLSQQDV